MRLEKGTGLQGGKYIIEDVLGQGGFGITYKAYQKALDRYVAVKEFFMESCCARSEDDATMTVNSGSSDGLVARFRAKFIKEARIIAELDSRHIIKIYDVFEENDTAYYVMEYLPGGDIRSLVPEGGLPENTAVSYVRQIAQALKVVHEKGLLHLDIKPSNILLRPNGDAVLIDFGVAKHYDSESGRQDTTTPVAISEGYAPSEQYDAGAVASFCAATDIYALGATLYFLLTGLRPPKASVVLNSGLPAMPARISRVVRRAVVNAMNPRVEGRPRSMDEFLRSLENGSSVWKKMFVFAGLAALAVLMGIGGWRYHQKHPRMEEPVVVVGETDSTENKGADLPVLTAADIPVKEPVSVPSQEDKAAKQPLPVQSDGPSQIKVTFADDVLCVNGIEYPMRRIAGGTFRMGATPEQGNNVNDNERPPHTVKVADFYIAKHELTQDVWEALMGENPSHVKGARLPVENVSWNDCGRFIKKLNALSGLEFALPTEAQWEYAARGGADSYGYKYSGGDFLGDIAWYDAVSSARTHEVGQLQANELGLYDMSGNVWEWCADGYGEYVAEYQENPVGVADGRGRVARGGSFMNGPGFCRVASRRAFTPDTKVPQIGFRLALKVK